MRELQAKTLAVLAKAEKADDHPTFLRAVREARSNVELLARLMGELQEQAQTMNVLIAPEWLTIRLAVQQALEPYSEAKSAVTAALKGFGNVGEAGR